MGNFSIETLRVPQVLWRFAQLKHGEAIGFLAALNPKTPPAPPPAPNPPGTFFAFDATSVVAEGGGWLRILADNVLPFDRVAITRIATTRERPDDIILDLAG